MRVLSASELLDVWEQGVMVPPVQRALTLLACACPELSPEELAHLSIGARDAHLLALRERVFGPQLLALADCPNCSGRVEVQLSVADIRVTPAIDPAEVFALNVDSYHVQFRLPNSLDVHAIADDLDLTAARQKLLDRCIVTAERNGATQPAGALPAVVVEAIAARMAEADPQADVQLRLSCPVCDCQWQSAFDTAEFFWSEINAWAGRVLRDVHTLALAYGWREGDILALRPWRRQAYLQMVGG